MERTFSPHARNLASTSSNAITAEAMCLLSWRVVRVEPTDGLSGVVCGAERDIDVMARRSFVALPADVVGPGGDGVQVVVPNERLDHDFGLFAEVICGDCGDDPVTLAAPAETDGGQQGDGGDKR